MTGVIPYFSRTLFLASLAASVCCLGANACAQTPAAATSATPQASSSSRPDALWRCELPGGVYLVALRSVVSVSSHEFVVDGAARVTEVTVATTSTVEARFYYLEPLTTNTPVSSALEQLQQHVQDLSAAHVGANDAPWQKVVKTYPTTTHAHTVEYRLASKSDLQSLRQSIEQAWTTGKGANFKIE